MDPATVFSFGSTLVLPGWLLLILAPKWQWTTRLATTVVIPVLLAVAYVALFAGNFPGAEGGFGSLEEVTLLFGNPHLVTAGWLHYLAFDLLVGSWIVRDASSEGIHHLWVVPCLVLCFMAGPSGYLLYLIIRAALRRKVLMSPIEVPA